MRQAHMSPQVYTPMEGVPERMGAMCHSSGKRKLHGVEAGDTDSPIEGILGQQARQVCTDASLHQGLLCRQCACQVPPYKERVHAAVQSFWDQSVDQSWDMVPCTLGTLVTDRLKAPHLVRHNAAAHDIRN